MGTSDVDGEQQAFGFGPSEQGGQRRVMRADGEERCRG